MKLKLFIVLTILVFLLNSCTKDAAQIPAFLKIDEITFNPTGTQSSASASIKYAFVYIDDEFIGGYELPIELPVLAAGETQVVIRPGIKANGITETPIEYPAYTSFETTLNFTPEETTSINPEVFYKSNVRFALNEEFESGNHQFTFDIDENPNTRIEIDGDGALEGRSGRISLTSTAREVIYGSEIITVLPKNNTPVWLEVDYKTDLPLIFGINAIDGNGNTEQFPEFGINTKQTWNKIYFDLSRFVNLTEFVAFQLFFGASLAEEDDSAEILLDNIKIVYFEN